MSIELAVKLDRDECSLVLAQRGDMVPRDGHGRSHDAGAGRQRAGRVTKRDDWRELDQIAVLAQLQSGESSAPLRPGQCAHEVTDILEILCGQPAVDLEQGKVEVVIAT